MESIGLSVVDKSISPFTDVVQAVPNMVEYIPCEAVDDAAAKRLQHLLTDITFRNWLGAEVDASIYFVCFR